MRVVSRKAIRDAVAKHSEWRASLNAWYKIAKNADWKNFAEVQNSWRNTDVVGRFVVFDIGHNRCRLIATIKYRWGMARRSGMRPIHCAGWSPLESPFG